MDTWQLQEAKSRFSELVECALRQGPQTVTRRGAEVVVVMAATDYKLIHSGNGLIKLLQQAPRGEPLDLHRSTEPIRGIDL